LLSIHFEAMSPPEHGGETPPVALHEQSTLQRYRPSRRTLGFLASVVLLALAFYYDYAILEAGTATVPFWDLTRFDWVLVACFVVVGWLGVAPLVSDPERTRRYWRQFRRDRLAVLGLGYLVVFTVVAAIGPILVGDQIASLYRAFQPPYGFSVDAGVVGECVGTVSGDRCHGTLQYPFGTNSIGLGVFYMLVHGARVSLLVALVAGAVVAPLGALVGITAGYVGGAVDELLMRYVDVQEAIPAFVVYILAAFFLGRDLLLLLAVFGLLSWGGVARLVRSETLQRRSTGYVRAARAAGAGRLHVIRRHILPNVGGTVVTATSQIIPGLLLAEVALGYLRLNEETLYSWGLLLSMGLSGYHGSFPETFSLGNFNTGFMDKWWIATSTAIAVAITIAAFALVGDRLREVLDPRST
jgi:peptide/nickel transport system permease protein